jgi:RNA polymerase-binding protein DksA
VAKSTNKAAAKKKAKPATKAKKAPSRAAKPARSTKAKPVAKVTTKAASAKSSSSKSALARTPTLKPVAIKATPARNSPTPINKLNSDKPANGKSPNGKQAKAATVSTIIPPPPPPRSKPSKSQAGFSTKELEVFRDTLLAKRRELVGDMRSMESEALQRSGENLSNLPLHMADMGTDNYEQEFTLGLMEKDRQLLREINQALSKIMDGRYGICEGTGKIIAKARLEVQPWAKYSIEHARKLENRGVR